MASALASLPSDGPHVSFVPGPLRGALKVRTLSSRRGQRWGLNLQKAGCSLNKGQDKRKWGKRLKRPEGWAVNPAFRKKAMQLLSSTLQIVFLALICWEQTAGLALTSTLSLGFCGKKVTWIICDLTKHLVLRNRQIPLQEFCGQLSWALWLVSSPKRITQPSPCACPYAQEEHE